MSLTAFGSIHRGLVNLRANWELIPVQLLQILLAVVLLLVGFLPPLAVLGFGSVNLVETPTEDLSALMDAAAGLLARGREAWVLLLAALVLSMAIWMMAMLVHCFFQGGIYGVLMAGDRQAPPGSPRGWPLFRTYSVRDLRGWGARYLWRYFWLLNLFLVIGTLWLVLPVVIILLAMWSEAHWGTGASLGIGCGGAVLFAFGTFVFAFWMSLAQADLAREESSVRRATRQGLLVLSRRLGAVILLAIAGILVSITFSVVFMVLSFLGQLGLGSSFAVQIGWMMAVNLTELLVSCVVGVAFIATLIALVRSEAPTEATP